jgi:hypothetical protein
LWYRIFYILRLTFVTITTVRISLGGDSFYLHCLVYRNMVGLRARFGAPLTGLNSPAVFMLLTIPSVFLRCMSMLFHTVLVTFVSLVVFSSTVSIFPFAPIFYLFYLSPPFPGSPVPFPCALWLYGPIFQSFICFLLVPY